MDNQRKAFERIFTAITNEIETIDATAINMMLDKIGEIEFEVLDEEWSKVGQ